MIGKTIYQFDELESTNEYLKKQANKLTDGDICFSLSQTKGKGRFGKIWISKLGNLYFSYIIKNSTNQNRVFEEIVRSSVAVQQVLMEYEIKSSIKFPNDILVENKKICGILIENISNQKSNNIIVGVGININQEHFEGIEQEATSIYLENNKKTPVKNVLNKFVKQYNLLQITDYNYRNYHENLIFSKKHIKYKDKLYNLLTVDEKGNFILENNQETIYLDYTEIIQNQFI